MACSFFVVQQHTETYSVHTKYGYMCEYWAEQMAIDMCKVNPGIMEKINKISMNRAWIKSQKNVWDLVCGKQKHAYSFDLKALGA